MLICTSCHRRPAADFPQDPETAACWACLQRERDQEGTRGSEDQASPLWAVAFALVLWTLILGFLWILI